MKNILFIDNGLEFGGGTRSLLYLIENLSKNKEYNIYVFFEFNYLISENTTINDYLRSLNINVIENNFNKLKVSKLKKEIFRFFSKDFLYKKQFFLNLDFVKEVLTCMKIDLIHLNNHFGSNLEYIYMANKLNIPVIQHLRKNSLLNKFQIKLLNNLKFYTISVSESTYNFYNNQINIDKCIIYNPFEFRDTSEINREISNDIIMFMPANYLENKGHSFVFRALDKVNRKDLKLFIAGSGQFEKDTEELKNKLLKENKLVELGFLKDLSSYYSKSDYIISFSENEGLPRVVLEGLSYGCSIITSNYSVSYEIKELLNDKSKYFILERDVKKLLEKLNDLNKPINYDVDPSISKTFSLNNYITSVENLYKEILQN